jgi:leucyl/phenylalanyl-tRNA--protein transferase
MSRRAFEITPDLLLRAYRAGLFPMAETRSGEKLHWLDPERRGVMPLERFHLPRRLARTVLSGPYRVTSDTAFAAVIAGCAETSPGRDDTWINVDIERMFNALHRMGHAHSVETYEGDRLVGGLYGVAIGGVFFGESMFTRARDASKTALVHLVARLRLGGFRLLDTQFLTSHLAQFGALEVPRDAYKAQLADALQVPASWARASDDMAIAAEITHLRDRAPATAAQ